MIIHGDCLEEMKKMEADSIDFVCTDPPYGYSFMGKDWDKAVPSVEIWQECCRILKPGGFAFVMSAPRSDVQQAMVERLIQGGFRLDFTPIYWTYASGFPKAGNIGKLVDKRLGAEREVVGIKDNAAEIIRRSKAFASKDLNIGFDRPWMHDDAAVETRTHITKASSPEAKALDGSYAGFQPKPAVEVILVAMKPLSEKTYVDQALKNGHGVTWLDDGRIPTGENLDGGAYAVSGNREDLPGAKRSTKAAGMMASGKTVGKEFEQPQGRFPANLLVSDDVLNDGVERKGVIESGSKAKAIFGNDMGTRVVGSTVSDSGSYSRYFDLDKWASTLPFLITPKASKSEKNKGLEHIKPKHASKMSGGHFTNQAGTSTTNIDRKYSNHHPTVKPLKLMSYLITLGSRPRDIVLDPFCGSGTTVVAAKKLQRKGIGIEREEEYVEIARARLAADKQERLF